MFSEKERFRDISPYSFRYSKPVDPDLYQNDDFLCNIRPRISHYWESVDAICWEARDVWSSIPGKSLVQDWWGTHSLISGNFGALYAAEFPKDRVLALAWFAEYLSLYDDEVDGAKDTDNAENVILERQSVEDDRETDMKLMQARTLVHFLEADPALGKGVVDELHKYLKYYGKEMRPHEFKTLEDYFNFRDRDFATPVWIALWEFGNDDPKSSMTAKDFATVSKLIKLTMQQLTLCNDYWSWDREFKEAQDKHQDGILTNAVHILMQSCNLDESAAKKRVKSELFDRQQRYEELGKDLLTSCATDSPIRRWCAFLDISISGNALFQMSAPRYHLHVPRPKRNNSILEPGIDEKSPAPKVPGTQKFEPVESNRQNLELRGQDTRESEAHEPNGGHLESQQPEPQGPENQELEIQTPITPSLQFNGTSSSSATFTLEGPPKYKSGFQDKLVLEPYSYVASLEGKRFRNELLSGMDYWFTVPPLSFNIIRDSITVLNNISLMLDDIEDFTPLRRGSPATHTIFGLGQTINSVNFMYIKTLESIIGLSTDSVISFFEELKTLHIGQQSDLHWTYHCAVPTESEYFTHAEQKTGALFRLAAKLIQTESATHQETFRSQLHSFMLLLGKHYQIRDDYLDLLSTQDTHNDLDQGNYSLPLIHALKTQSEKNEGGNNLLRSILQARNESKSMSWDMKKLVMKILEKEGSLEYTRFVLRNQICELRRLLEELEVGFGRKNWIFRLLLFRLEL